MDMLSGLLARRCVLGGQNLPLAARSCALPQGEGYQSTGFDDILFGATSWSTTLMLKVALMQSACQVHMCRVPAHRQIVGKDHFHQQ